MNRYRYYKAVCALSHVINSIADELPIRAKVLREDAPNTFKDMKAFYEKYGYLGISNEGNTTSIYSPNINIKFRKWHDYIHLVYDLSFSQTDEHLVSAIQCQRAYLKGLELGYSESIVNDMLKVLEADTRGQVDYYFKHKDFVPNQSKFILDYLGVN